MEATPRLLATTQGSHPDPLDRSTSTLAPQTVCVARAFNGRVCGTPLFLIGPLQAQPDDRQASEPSFDYVT